VLTLGMIASVVPLLLAIRALKKKTVIISQQIHTLVLIFSVFSISYLAITIYDLALTRSIKFVNVLIGTLLDFLADFTPLTMMFVFHVKEVQRAKNAERESATFVTLSTNTDKSFVLPTNKDSSIDRNSILVKSIGCLVSAEIGTFTDVKAAISSRNKTKAMMVSQELDSSLLNEKLTGNFESQGPLIYSRNQKISASMAQTNVSHLLVSADVPLL